MGSIFAAAPLLYIALPVVLVTGWVRGLRPAPRQDRFVACSKIGFTLATVSASLAVGSALFATIAGGFRHYDPALMRIFRIGILVSLLAVVFAVLGLWRRSVLRWHAPILSFGMLFLWFVWAASE